MAAVLITDGEQRAALATVRSLGAAGHRVEVCSTRGRSLAGASCYARNDHRVPAPLTRPADFVLEVERLLREREIDVLLPISEPSLLAVLPRSDHLRNVQIPFPPVEVFRTICDKERVLEAAKIFGIATPHQAVITRPGPVSAQELERLTYPVVVKPSRSVGENGAGRTKLSVRHAADGIQLRSILGMLPEAAYPILLQERIVGPGVGVFLLLREGEVVARFAHRRIREKPPSGGVSVYRESIKPPPDLVEQSHALLRHFEWWGVAMVEYKLDAHSGIPYLMEVNGRFWGSLQLAIDAGVDFPNLLLRASSGEDLTPVTQYITGIRSRWEWGEVDHLLARLRRSTDALALPPDAPGRGTSLLNFIRWRACDRSEVFRRADPIPLLRESLDWFTRR
jgi:predicted ATP-grasp superfamily ATP-dependent carboligase